MNVNDLERWLAGYKAAWESRDAEAVCRLFTLDALYYETPYAEPFKGHDGIRDYWSSVTADQRDVAFSSDVIGVIEPTGIARWSAKFKLASNGADVELNGVFLLQFNAEG